MNICTLYIDSLRAGDINGQFMHNAMLLTPV